MAIEYLLVTFPEQRAVLADGEGVGFTNHTFMLPTDEYLITLDGGGTEPPSQDIALSGTSLVKPMVIAFAPSAPSPRAAAPAGVPAPAPHTARSPAPASPARATRRKRKRG